MHTLLKLLLTSTLCFVAYSFVMAQDAPPKKVAVYVTGDVEDGIKKVIGSKLVSGITHSANYTAVERTGDFLGELMKEQDYQLSGAVTDSQIARIGQQFGVQYVVVADISEVFESMFISARMIDVQTAQITNSTDANQVVTDMAGLTTIAEKIVSDIMWIKKFSEDDIKQIGAISKASALYELKIPEDYQIATLEEINDLIIDFGKIGKKLSFPIYTDINFNTITETQYYQAHFKDADEDKRTGPIKSNRPYKRIEGTVTIVDEQGESRQEKLLFHFDDSYSIHYNVNIYGDFYTTGLYDMNQDHSLTPPGYVYLIKIKEQN